MSSHDTRQQAVTARRLLESLDQFSEVVIVTHDNPDPDAIASGWAIQELVHHELKKPVRFVAGGAITRAENRHLIELLKPPLELTDDLDADDSTALVLVDCSLGSSNQLVTRRQLLPTAVIDHHHCRGQRPPEVLTDIREDAAATVSIAASYMRERGMLPSPGLASAIIYAIRTETRGCETTHSEIDRDAIAWATCYADPTVVARIESAPLPGSYFNELYLALEQAQVMGDTAFCLLPAATGAEVTGEIADLLIRHTGTRRALCGLIVGDDLFVSVRTEEDSENAAELVRETLSGWGRGGGHEHRAGGKVTGLSRLGLTPYEVSVKLETRWLSACGVQRSAALPLVSSWAERNQSEPQAGSSAVESSSIPPASNAEPAPSLQPIIGWREWVTLPGLHVPAIKAKIDSGARSSAIHAYAVQEFEQDGQQMVRFRLHPYQRYRGASIDCVAPIHEYRHVKSSSGHVTLRPVILTSLSWNQQTWSIELTLANRDDMGFRLLLGRESFRGRFLLDATRSFHGGLPPRSLRRPPSRKAKKKKKKLRHEQGPDRPTN